jgi:DNA-damage-inducible protein J
MLMCDNRSEVITLEKTKSTINVKIDKSVKDTAVMLLDRMGIDQTTAIDMFYRKIIAVKSLPFQPEPLLTNAEQLHFALKNKKTPNITLSSDENGYAIVDTDKYPQLNDWVAEG